VGANSSHGMWLLFFVLAFGFAGSASLIFIMNFC
jgi:hypothetical protein